MDVQLPKKLPDSNNEWGTLVLIICFAALAAIGRTLSRKGELSWRTILAAVFVSVSVAVMTFAFILHTTSGVSGFITVAIASASGTFTEIILSKIQGMIEAKKVSGDGRAG